MVPLGYPEINVKRKVLTGIFSLGTIILTVILRGSLVNHMLLTISCYKKKLPVEMHAINKVPQDFPGNKC
jgi:hypothetical protein